MEVGGELQVLIALLLGKVPSVPLDRRLVGSQNFFGRCREEKKYVTSVGNRIRTVNFVPILTCILNPRIKYGLTLT
jgi:hypothetical protein